MEILIDNIIRKRYMSGFTRSKKPFIIVLHATAGGNTLEWMRSMNNERASNYRKGIGLFHYLIQSNGQIVEIINPSKWVYHAHAGQKDSESIGIEIEKFDPTNMIDATSKQYTSLIYLINKLKKDYPITRIESHRYRARKYSGYNKWQCPMTLNVNKILNGIQDNRVFKMILPFSDDKLAW